MEEGDIQSQASKAKLASSPIVYGASTNNSISMGRSSKIVTQVFKKLEGKRTPQEMVVQKEQDQNFETVTRESGTIPLDENLSQPIESSSTPPHEEHGSAVNHDSQLLEETPARLTSQPTDRGEESPLKTSPLLNRENTRIDDAPPGLPTPMESETRLPSPDLLQSEKSKSPSPGPESPLRPKSYKYNALPDRPGAIRLLKLYASRDENEDILGALVSPKVSQTIQYEALSWCWGTQPRTAKIFLRKKTRPSKKGPSRTTYAMNVSPELSTALKFLRAPSKPRYLWIDAICINQDNLVEKNHQVGMMHNIYANARQVRVWLGEASLSSSIAFQFIKDEVLQFPKSETLFADSAAVDKWKAVFEVMQRPWFYRRWVVQEITLARAAVIHCGQDTISWSDFAVAVELFGEAEKAMKSLSDVLEEHSNYSNFPSSFTMVSSLGASLLVSATNHLFRDHEASSKVQFDSDSEAENHKSKRNARLHPVSSPWRQPLLSLEYLVSTLTLFETSVPHDSFYALLSIARETATNYPAVKVSGSILPGSLSTTQHYKIDYQAPYVDACRDFIQFNLRYALTNDRRHRSRALDIICRPWAIDQKRLSSTKKTNKIQMNDLESEKPRFLNSDDLPLPTWVPQLSKASYGMISFGTQTPRAMRKNADPLVGLTSSSGGVYSAADFKDIDLSSLKFRKRTSLVSQPDHYSMYARGFCLDKIKEVADVSVNGMIPMSWANVGDWPNTNSPAPNRFWRTLVANRGPDGNNPPLYYSYACSKLFKRSDQESGAVNTEEFIENERDFATASFCRRVQSVIWGRALAKTRKGFLCIVDKNVRSGDMACIIYGCSVPLVIRKNKRKSEAQYEEELKCEIKNSVNVIGRYFLQFLERRKQLRRRKQEDMARIWVQWAEETGALKQPVLTRESLLILTATKMTEFNTWRNEKSMEKTHYAIWTTSESRGHSSQPSIHGKTPKEIPAKANKGSIDWWEFDLQLKYARRWLKKYSARARYRTSLSGSSWYPWSNVIYALARKKNHHARPGTLIETESAEYMAVIREKLRQQHGDDGYYSYNLLGEAYVHGMMDGEAMTYQTEGRRTPIPSQVFEIR